MKKLVSLLCLAAFMVSTLFGSVFAETDIYAEAENAIDSIQFDDVVVYQGLDSVIGGDNEAYYYIPIVLSQVLLKDGSYGKIIYDGCWNYKQVLNWASDNSAEMQEREPWVVGNSYEVTGELCGVSATFTVHVRENPIKSIELLKAPDQKEISEFNSDLNLQGAVINVSYTDGTNEVLSLNYGYNNNVCRGGALYSYKLNRSFYFYGGYHYGEPGVTSASLILRPVQYIYENEYVLEYPITIVDPQVKIEGVTIQEGSDKILTLTFYNADQSSFECKCLDLAYLYSSGEPDSDGTQTYDTIINTTMGAIHATIYECEDSLCFEIDNGEENVLMSNSITKSEWFEMMKRLLWHPLYKGYGILESQYSGEVTSGNIDSIALMAADLESIIYIGLSEEMQISGQKMRAYILKHFKLDHIDLSLSEAYDAENDIYNLCMTTVGGGDMRKSGIDEISYCDGIWHITTSMDKNLIRLKMDSDLKIISYSFGNIEGMGDVNDDGVIDNQDVEQLLWFTLFPEEYKVDEYSDFDGNGQVDNQDVENLLWYTLFPETYSLR